MKCHHCTKLFVVGDLIITWNGEKYHQFCKEVYFREYSHRITEKVRREMLLEKNPWLEEFMMTYRLRRFNRD